MEVGGDYHPDCQSYALCGQGAELTSVMSDFSCLGGMVISLSVPGGLGRPEDLSTTFRLLIGSGPGLVVVVGDARGSPLLPLFLPPAPH